MPRFRPLATAVTLALVASLAAAPAVTAKTKITMSGSTSMYPLVKKVATAFVHQPKYKGKVSLSLLQGGSDTGITDVSRGRVSIGNSSRDPKSADPSGIVFNKVARDAVCVITNKSNPISSVSQAQVQQIFSGRVRNWGTVPGARATGTIDLVVRTAASGTQDAFQNIFMGPNLRVSGSATTKSSNGLQAQAVKSNPNAIGYASFNFTRGLHTVPYRGVQCNLRNAKSGSYRGARNFYMVTRGQPKGVVKAFIRYIRRSATAKRIVATNWVPLR